MPAGQVATVVFGQLAHLGAMIEMALVPDSIVVPLMQ
jgi:hypothetical protein